MNFAHDGVRELMRVQVLLQNEANIFAEIDMDFVFSKDRPDYPFGNRRAGERITVKMFCLYFLRGDKIAKMKMASWAPDHGRFFAPNSGFRPAISNVRVERRGGGGSRQRIPEPHWQCAVPTPR